MRTQIMGSRWEVDGNLHEEILSNCDSRQLSKPGFGHSAGSTRSGRPHCKTAQKVSQACPCRQQQKQRRRLFGSGNRACAVGCGWLGLKGERERERGIERERGVALRAASMSWPWLPIFA